MKSTKAILLLAIFALGVLVVPTTEVKAQGGGIDFSNPDTVESFNQYAGSIFSLFRGFGASGEMLGNVLMFMFQNFTTMNNTQIAELPGVYVLNASKETTYTNLQFQYGSGHQNTFVPYPYSAYNLSLSPNPEYQDETPYFVMQESGTVTYNKTEGVSITFIIWDSDGSFIEAIDQVIDSVKTFMEITRSEEPDETKIAQAANAAAEALTYFLIHINDIITGNEVIITNVIAYTEYSVDWGSGAITGTWYSTFNHRKRYATADLLATVYPNYDADYTAIATAREDETMLTLLNPISRGVQHYTQFSFDLIEIWLKNFEVHINVAKIMEGVLAAQQAVALGLEPPPFDATLTEVFQGLDIEFYIFTHSFQNWYLYDESKFDSTIYSAEIQALANNDRPDVAQDRTDPEFVKIVDSEITDYILFQGGDWSFKEPEYDPAQGMTWGVQGDSLTFRLIPVGLKPEDVDMVTSPVETMDRYVLGFTFDPEEEYTVNTADYITGSSGTESMGHAKVKLIQEFGEWNGGAGPLTPRLGSKELDLTTLFMSTIIHVHLEISNEQIDSETAETAMLGESDYNSVAKKIRVGDDANGMPLAEIDIAGLTYDQYDAGTTFTQEPASSNIIPTVYASVDAFSSNTYAQEDNSTGQLNASLTLELSVLLYAVAYPTFNSDGFRIVHDPTFSIFITIENPGVWAIILVVGVVTLVGVAALLITKRKEAAAGL